MNLQKMGKSYIIYTFSFHKIDFFSYEKKSVFNQQRYKKTKKGPYKIIGNFIVMDVSINNSNYKHESMVRREVFVGPAVTEEFKRIIMESGITQVDDQNWEEPEARQQELEIKIGNQHIAFTCREIGSLVDIQKSKDPEGLKTFYYLTQDLKCLVLSLITMHFKVRPIP